MATDTGLQIVDVSEPSRPALAGHIDVPDLGAGAGSNLFVSRNLVYITNGWASNYNVPPMLKIVDVSEPSAPSLVETFATSIDALEVFVKGNLA